MSLPVKFTPEHGIATVHGQSMLFHCNHYNRYLQQTIEDPTYIDSEKILVQSAAETVYLQLKEYGQENPEASLKECFDYASEIFKFAGFGLLDFSAFVENGGAITVKNSHFGLALKLNLANRSKPGEIFDKGFIAGTIEAFKDKLGAEFQTFSINQTSSISLGDEGCEFQITAGGTNAYPYLEKVEAHALPDFCEIPAGKFETPFEEAGIVTAVAGLPLVGDEEGLIPAFGVYLTRMYGDYYNKVSFRFEQAISEALENYDIAKELLIESGHICAFNTFGGIMTSDEWKALIQPALRNKEDWVHAMVAVTNALGWGIWRVEELVSGEKLVMRIYEDYESLGYLRWFGQADHMVNYLMTGGCAGLMNLVYHGDITQGPKLDKELYYQLFKEGNYFVARQTKCLAKGDAYTEIVATRKDSN